MNRYLDAHDANSRAALFTAIRRFQLGPDAAPATQSSMFAVSPLNHDVTIPVVCYHTTQEHQLTLDGRTELVCSRCGSVIR